jgi:hypothetical protein
VKTEEGDQVGQVVVQHIDQLQPLLEILPRQLHHKETLVEHLFMKTLQL